MDQALILANVAKHILLSEDESAEFIALFHTKRLRKKELLLRAGEPCTTFNFVNQGALRAFYSDADDKEATIMFAVQNWWITDMPCFVTESPAMISIEAISECDVLQITKRQMDSLLASMPKFERYFRILMQNAYVREQLRTLQNLSLPAETRYLNFVQKYPAISSQVPLKHIASYLGITPEFLSAIRNKVSKGLIS